MFMALPFSNVYDMGAPEPGINNAEQNHRTITERGNDGAAPPDVTEHKALAEFGPDTVYYVARLDGTSNERAEHQLNFRPASLA